VRLGGPKNPNGSELKSSYICIHKVQLKHISNMKKILFLLLTAVLLFACEPSTATAQRTITYEVTNGYFLVKSGTTKLVTLSVLDAKVDTLQRPLNNFDHTTLRFIGNGTAINLRYSPTLDTIAGRTAVQARDIMNQTINAAKGNYLGAYKKSQLIAPDTAFTGNYYYDTDSATFRFKRATGGFQSIQPKF